MIIVDALGKKFINQNIGSNSIVLKDQLSAGIYFASVYGKNSKLLAVKKIIKL